VPLSSLWAAHWYGPAVFAIVVEGGEDPALDVRAFSRLGVSVDGGNEEPTLHATLLVGNSFEVEGQGDLEAFGLRGLVRIGIEVDVAAQPTVFDIVQGVLNAQASQYNVAGTVGNKINSASAAGDPWGADLDGYAPGSAGHLLQILHKVATNKMVTDPVTGVLTIYADDGTTPLLNAQLYKDAAGTEPYNGTGAERRERLT
jgi:hypothetical protein